MLKVTSHRLVITKNGTLVIFKEDKGPVPEKEVAFEFGSSGELKEALELLRELDKLRSNEFVRDAIKKAFLDWCRAGSNKSDYTKELLIVSASIELEIPVNDIKSALDELITRGDISEM